jgi:L-lysine exporter family protein LysE/ArgO
VLARPAAWRVLDTVIAGVMLVLAVQILLPLVPTDLGEGARIAVATVVCAALAGAVTAWSAARRRRADAERGAEPTGAEPTADEPAPTAIGTVEGSALLR